MPETIVSIDTSAIRPGRLAEVEAGFKELVAFVEANEPRTISYGVYFDDSRERVTVLQVHPDSASMEFHMQAAAPIFSGFKDLLTLETIDVYGAPSHDLLAMLRRKSEMLGRAPVTVHPLHAAVERFGSP